ncbi:hypothetical protein HpNP4_21080 [Helicobacter pylori]
MAKRKIKPPKKTKCLRKEGLRKESSKEKGSKEKGFFIKIPQKNKEFKNKDLKQRV